ncbi:MAG: OB-fold nucleic acid binding domain-containing protein [Bacteroidales bacterium]|nr:OB-fold nucleic acid binding domain-containing protein [Candidatus Cryptobacteroides faecihippi]
MKKTFISILSCAAVILSSCEEWDPVLTLKNEDPEHYENSTADSQVVKEGQIQVNTTIAELAAMYTNGKPFEIQDDITIAGRVITTDQPGNFYKSFYIQDETGAIEIKIGKTSLYNDYALGQKVYVKCGPQPGSKGLFLGSYGYKSGSYGGNGMVQLGCEDPTGDYETSYIEDEYIINKHIFRGSPKDIQIPAPEKITAAQLPSANSTLKTCKYIGQRVTLEGLKYGGQAFALLYINGNESNKNSKNRVFLSDTPWNISTWAMSKTNFLTHLRAGDWDEAQVGNSGDYNYGTVGSAKLSYVEETDPAFFENVHNDNDFKFSVNKLLFGDDMASYIADGDLLAAKWVRYCLVKNANGYSVSQYFTMGGSEIQIRTSGFSKFADKEIDEAVLAGAKTITVTGVLSLYQGSIQLVLNNLDDVVINE